ncbi:MAG: PLP-dependent aminotransferase family protein [Verrucomicrobiota bacterium]
MNESTHPVRYSSLGERAREPVITDLMHRALDNAKLLSLAAGFTDNVTLPVGLVKDAVAALDKDCPGGSYLQYGTNRGRVGLLAEVAKRLNDDPGEALASALTAEEVFITNGSQQALYLAMQTLCDPGDVILVQQPTYFVFLELCRGLGIEAVSLPMHSEGGIDLAALPDFFRQLKQRHGRERIKAAYLNSYFCNPSSRSMSVEEKRAFGYALLENALTVPVLEDAAYRELWFDLPWPAPSILSLPEYTSLPCLYLGTFTKPFATGLKVGYGICSDPTWLGKMLALKGHQDFGTSHFNQAIIEHVLSAGAYEPHLRKLRTHYRAKAQVMGDVLAASPLRELGWHWERPEGGLYYWMQAPDGFDLSINAAFCEACLQRGVLFVPGNLCVAEGQPRNLARLSFGALAKEQLAEATTRFTAVAAGFDPA